MERIIYRKTLDVHKNGVQFTLQGFETADNMSRTIELSLMASGDTIDLPSEQITAIMYVTTPNATEPSINKCTIKDNKIVYDVLPIVEEGITEMQLKLISTRAEGANGVLPSPRFAVEVTKSNADDESAMQTPTFTALEDAIARANGVYEARLLRIELDSDCMFRAYFADGTVYESDVLKELFLKGDALLSQSYARGGTGIRTGEDTDNSMYYSNASKSSSIEANTAREQTLDLLDEVKKHGVYTAFSVDFETGEVMYLSPKYTFNVNKENGQLEAIGEAYTFEETVELIVTEWLEAKGANISELQTASAKHTEDIAANKADIETNKEDIASLSAEIGSTRNDIASVNRIANENSDNISILQSQMSSEQGEYNDIIGIFDEDFVYNGTPTNSTATLSCYRSHCFMHIHGKIEINITNDFTWGKDDIFYMKRISGGYYYDFRQSVEEMWFVVPCRIWDDDGIATFGSFIASVSPQGELYFRIYDLAGITKIEAMIDFVIPDPSKG